MNRSRRNFLSGSAALSAGLLASHGISAQHHHEEMSAPSAQPAGSGEPGLVQTPDLPKLPWTLEGGVKVFNLTAEVVKRKFLPAKTFDVWGYNGVCPGPTIEVNEGDRVRIVFRNNLPEPTSIHWHGLEVPIPMDGVPAISQPLIQPGQTFTYEFTLHQNGTFFYHSHMPMQEMMGQIGFFIIHPMVPHQPKVDKDFGIILQEWAILPNNTVPNSLSMEFNWLTFNGKAGPDSTPMIVRLGDRVRIRFVNLGMDHHPMHLHGNQFFVTGTEGGRIPQTAWYPGNTVLVGVAQARDIEFDAKRAGDWMLHCHLPHHMMNQMASMVGPMAHMGSGMHTGMGMEEGMGIVRNSGATSEELGPSLGRGTGLAAHETSTSHLVGQQQERPHQMDMKKAPPAQDQQRKLIPGYPQDMFLTMDEEVAKPETYGLAEGWTGAMMGMMTVVRVLPPDMYDKVMDLVKKGRAQEPKPTDHIHR
jgi:FtsP/CotA-like multicopper oxidase with cupredoxin domain